jgi:integrase
MICNNCNRIVPDGIFCTLCGWNQQKVPARSTLAAIHERWMKRKHYRSLTPIGQTGYDTAWDKHLSVLSDRLISDIDLDTYQAVLDEMAQDGLSLSTQQKVQQLIGQLCKLAKAEGLIAVNPAPELILDGWKSRTTLPFEDQHIRKLMICAEDAGSRWQQAARVTLCLIFTGYRPEELFNIRRKDINPRDGFLIGGSKTAAGKDRIVPVLGIIAPYITDWYLSCPLDPNAYLIRGPKGGRKNLSNWRKREFYPMTLELGINRPDQLVAKKALPHITPYSCRHTFATLAWRADVDADALIKLIGHTDIKTTTKYYIHTDYVKMQHEANKIDGFWNSLVS